MVAECTEVHWVGWEVEGEEACRGQERHAVLRLLQQLLGLRILVEEVVLLEKQEAVV